MVAGGVFRCAALHPVLPLRAHLRRRHGRERAGRRSIAAWFRRSRPINGDHLECDECGACIDICPVGALTSGTYRYQTRPWEMKHVGTICTHCSDGCKTTLGVRNDQIIRGNNRDRSGINGEFLCIKGRYAFDFYDHPERLQAPLMRDGRQAGRGVLVGGAGGRGGEVQRGRRRDGGSFGVIGSNHTTNEENYLPAEVRAPGARAPTTSIITAPATWPRCSMR